MKVGDKLLCIHSDQFIGTVEGGVYVVKNSTAYPDLIEIEGIFYYMAVAHFKQLNFTYYAKTKL